MDIRINLLPQTYSTKEKSSVFLIPVLGIAAVVVVGSLLAYSYFDKKDSIQTLSDRIAARTTTRDSLLTEYQVKTAGVTEFNFIDKYKEMDEVLGSIYVLESVLEERVRSQLPEKSEITAYTYMNSGELTMTVNFFSKGDSAIYLDRLLQAPFINEAQLVNITLDEETFTYDATFELNLNTLVGVDQ